MRAKAVGLLTKPSPAFEGIAECFWRYCVYELSGIWGYVYLVEPQGGGARRMKCRSLGLVDLQRRGEECSKMFRK